MRGLARTQALFRSIGLVGSCEFYREVIKTLWLTGLLKTATLVLQLQKERTWQSLRLSVPLPTILE